MAAPQKNSLAQRTAAQAANIAPASGGAPKSIAEFLNRNQSAFAAVLPKHMTADRLVRIALSSIRLNPDLGRCTVASLAAAVMECAKLGLEPGIFGHAYLVPYGSEAGFIAGYQGLIELALRHPQVRSVIARVVYEKDTFEVAYGLNEKLEHVPTRDADPGQWTDCYAIYRLANGESIFLSMSRAQIEDHKRRFSKARKGPFADPANMPAYGMKTCIRMLAKYAPKSVELQRALILDDTPLASPDLSRVDETPSALSGVSDAEYAPVSTQEGPGETRGEEAAPKTPVEPSENPTASSASADASGETLTADEIRKRVEDAGITEAWLVARTRKISSQRPDGKPTIKLEELTDDELGKLAVEIDEVRANESGESNE